MKYSKEITVYPKQYSAIKLRVEGDSWEEVNKQIKKEFNKIKHTLPQDEVELAEELIK
jgi:hypothetical protein